MPRAGTNRSSPPLLRNTCKGGPTSISYVDRAVPQTPTYVTRGRSSGNPSTQVSRARNIASVCRRLEQDSRDCEFSNLVCPFDRRRTHPNGTLAMLRIVVPGWTDGLPKDLPLVTYVGGLWCRAIDPTKEYAAFAHKRWLTAEEVKRQSEAVTAQQSPVIGSNPWNVLSSPL
eukprot:1188609-Prorocentrum_minimum.AAC.1